MLPQHLTLPDGESSVRHLDTGHTGRLIRQVVYQARGRARVRRALYTMSFTADDEFQEWDEEDQDYSRSSIVAEFRARDEMDAYVARNFASL